LKLSGRIASFDEARGDGVFRSDNDDEFYFHCVVIADGSRTITPGAPALALRRVGHLGRDEVDCVETLHVQ